MKDVLGGKGAGLAEMTNAGVPVPPGLHDHDRGLQPLLRRAAARSRRRSAEQQATRSRGSRQLQGKKLGDPTDPLLVSVRSGAKFSMPGMMDTILNLGLNDQSVDGLAAKTGNPRFAWDSYRRFISMFGNVVLDIDKEQFEDELIGERKRKRGVEVGLSTSTPTTSKELVATFKQMIARSTGDATSRRIRARSSTWRATPSSAPGTTTARDLLPQAERDPRRPRHRGQRAGDGLRQHGRRPRHRRRLHPQSRPPARRSSTASTC